MKGDGSVAVYNKPYISIINDNLSYDKIIKIRKSNVLLILSLDEEKIVFTDDEPGVWALNIVGADERVIYADKVGYFRPFTLLEKKPRIESKGFITITSIKDKMIIPKRQFTESVALNKDLEEYLELFTKNFSDKINLEERIMA